MQHLRLSTTLVLLLLSMMAAKSFGQEGEISANVSLLSGSAIEHIPVPIEIHLSNNSPRNVEIFPYDFSRLPEVVLSIQLDESASRATQLTHIVSTGVPRVILRPSETLVLTDYLQDYVHDLNAGTHNITYGVHWQYVTLDIGERRDETFVEASGTLSLEIQPSSPGALNDYIANRLNIIRESVDVEQKNRAAKEITLINDASVVPALLSIKDYGYEADVLFACARLPMNESKDVLVALASSSKNPGIVRGAANRLEGKGQQLPSDVIRGLFDSQNKWLQLEAIDYVKRQHRGEFATELRLLAESSDVQVRSAANSALNGTN